MLLASYIEPIFALLTKWLGQSLLDPSIYFINFIPSLLQWQDVVLTLGAGRYAFRYPYQASGEPASVATSVST